MEISEQVYSAAAARELGQLLEALDVLGDEVDVELSSDILTIEFPTRDRCVINSHRAARQIWMAANRSAWHFDYRPNGTWLATKTGEELWSVISRIVSEKLGRSVQLARLN